MIKYYKFFTLITIIFSTYSITLLGQTKSDLKPKIIIDEFIRKIGGEKWLTLKSRREYAFVEYEEGKEYILPTNKVYYQIKTNLQPGISSEVHKYSTGKNTIMVYKSECNWYYTSSSLIVKFFGPEPVKYKNKFPRTELMEILNLEPMKNVYIEDTLYRLDFKDIRQLDRKQSLFFGMKSGLLYKRSYLSKNSVLWEYHFSNYTESQKFSEPYMVKLTANGEDYFNISVESIIYNIGIDPTIFDPPIDCRNYDYYEYLEFPYVLNID